MKNKATKKKPIKNSSIVTGSNFETLYFTYKQAVTFARKRVTELNKAAIRSGHPYRYTFVGVKDCGSHFSYTII